MALRGGRQELAPVCGIGFKAVEIWCGFPEGGCEGPSTTTNGGILLVRHHLGLFWSYRMYMYSSAERSLGCKFVILCASTCSLEDRGL